MEMAAGPLFTLEDQSDATFSLEERLREHAVAAIFLRGDW